MTEPACSSRPGNSPCIESIETPGHCTFCKHRMRANDGVSPDPRTNGAREVALREHIAKLGVEPTQRERDWFRGGWRAARDQLREVADQSIRDVTASLEAEQRRSAELEAELARLMEERNGNKR
jgi:hypothetical protein